MPSAATPSSPLRRRAPAEVLRRRPDLRTGLRGRLGRLPAGAVRRRRLWGSRGWERANSESETESKTVQKVWNQTGKGSLRPSLQRKDAWGQTSKASEVETSPTRKTRLGSVQRRKRDQTNTENEIETKKKERLGDQASKDFCRKNGALIGEKEHFFWILC